MKNAPAPLNEIIIQSGMRRCEYEVPIVIKFRYRSSRIGENFTSSLDFMTSRVVICLLKVSEEIHHQIERAKFSIKTNYLK